MMVAASFLRWTKERMFSTLLGPENERFLDYFIDLPGSFSLKGFLDSAELRNVTLNAKKISAELFQRGIPLRVKYGCVGLLNVQLFFAQARSHVTLEGVTLVLGPPLCNTELVTEVVDHKLGVFREHVQTAIASITRSQRIPLPKTQASSSPSGPEVSSPERSPKPDWRHGAAWLFRYDPNFTVSIKNLHLRYEDDVTEDAQPSHVFGFVWNVLNIDPTQENWGFTWPESKQQPSSTSETSGTLLLGSLRKSGFPGSETHEKVQHEGIHRTRSNEVDDTCKEKLDETSKSLFLGELKSCGLYCDQLKPLRSRGSRVDSKRHVQDYDHLCGGVLSVNSESEDYSQEHKWIVAPFDLEFHFGVEKREQIEGQRNSGTLRKSSKQLADPVISVEGPSFFLRILQRLEVTVDNEVLRALVGLQESWSRFLLWHCCARSLENSKLMSTEEGQPISVQTRWERCSKLFRLYRNTLRKKRHISAVMDQRIIKRRFVGFIRQWFLQFHLKHPKGRVRLYKKYPYISRPLAALSADFILGNDTFLKQKKGVDFRDEKKESGMKDGFLELKNSFSSRDAVYTDPVQCCQVAHFEELGLSTPPLAYLFLVPTDVLVKTLKADRDVQFVVDVLCSQEAAVLAQWYLIAVREAEEILMLSQERLLSGTSTQCRSYCNRGKSIQGGALTESFLLRVDELDVGALSQFLERDTSFYPALRQAIILQKASRHTMMQRLMTSAVWQRGLIKHLIAADFYEVYASVFPHLLCKLVDVAALFSFKEQHYDQQREQFESMAAVILDVSQRATPAERVAVTGVDAERSRPAALTGSAPSSHQTDRNASVLSVSSIESIRKPGSNATRFWETPWQQLVEQLTHGAEEPSYSGAKQVAPGPSWTIPDIFLDMSYGLYCDDIHLVLTDTEDSSVEKTGNYVISLRRLGVEFQCHKKIVIMGAFKDLRLLFSPCIRKMSAVCHTRQPFAKGPFAEVRDASVGTMKQSLITLLVIGAGASATNVKRQGCLPNSNNLEELHGSNVQDRGLQRYPLSLEGNSKKSKTVDHDQPCGEQDTHATAFGYVLEHRPTSLGLPLENTDNNNEHRRSDTQLKDDKAILSLMPKNASKGVSHRISESWNFLTCNCLTQTMAKGVPCVTFPMFLNTEVHLNDADVFFYPKAFDELRRVLVSFYIIVSQTQRNNAMGPFDWMPEKNQKLASEASASLLQKRFQYRADFYSSVLPFYLSIQTDVSKTFWEKRLETTINALTTFSSPISVVTALNARSPGADNEHSGWRDERITLDANVVDKSQLSIRLRIPGFQTKLFAPWDEPCAPSEKQRNVEQAYALAACPPGAFAELSLASRHIEITTVRTRRQKWVTNDGQFKGNSDVTAMHNGVYVCVISEGFNLSTKCTSAGQSFELWRALCRLAQYRLGEAREFFQTLSLTSLRSKSNVANFSLHKVTRDTESLLQSYVGPMAASLYSTKGNTCQDATTGYCLSILKVCLSLIRVLKEVKVPDPKQSEVDDFAFCSKGDDRVEYANASNQLSQSSTLSVSYETFGGFGGSNSESSKCVSKESGTVLPTLTNSGTSFWLDGLKFPHESEKPLHCGMASTVPIVQQLRKEISSNAISSSVIDALPHSESRLLCSSGTSVNSSEHLQNFRDGILNVTGFVEHSPAAKYVKDCNQQQSIKPGCRNEKCAVSWSLPSIRKSNAGEPCGALEQGATVGPISGASERRSSNAGQQLRKNVSPYSTIRHSPSLGRLAASRSTMIAGVHLPEASPAETLRKATENRAGRPSGAVRLFFPIEHSDVVGCGRNKSISFACSSVGGSNFSISGGPYMGLNSVGRPSTGSVYRQPDSGNAPTMVPVSPVMSTLWRKIPPVIKTIPPNVTTVSTGVLPSAQQPRLPATMSSTEREWSYPQPLWNAQGHGSCSIPARVRVQPVEALESSIAASVKFWQRHPGVARQLRRPVSRFTSTERPAIG